MISNCALGKSEVEWALDDAKWHIQDGSIERLKAQIDEHKDYVFKDGEVFIDKLLDICINLAKSKNIQSFYNISMAVKYIVENGANYKKYINDIITLKNDYRASVFLRLYIKNGLRNRKVLTKIAKDALKNKKIEVLKVVQKSGIKLARSLMKKMKRAVKNQGVTILVLHMRVLKDLKNLFRKKNKQDERSRSKSLTQTEGFLNVWFDKKGRVKDYGKLIKQILQEEYTTGWACIKESDLSLYVNLIKSMVEKEREYGDYYAFYHGHSSAVGFIFDIQTSIIKWLQIDKKKHKDVYMRFKTMVQQESMCDFLQSCKDFFKKHFWPDCVEPLRSKLLSVNLSVFGNTNCPGECTLQYFIKGMSISNPSDIIYKIFADLGLDEGYIERLQDVYSRYMVPKKGGNILQILIPKDQVDNFAYLSHGGGKPFRHKISGIQYDYAEGHHKNISEFLETLKIKPFTLQTEHSIAKNVINDMQGRIVFMPKFYDPQTGIKIIRHNFVSKKNKRKYKEKFREIVDQMMSKWIESQEYNKLKEDGINKKLLRLLKFMQKAKIKGAVKIGIKRKLKVL